MSDLNKVIIQGRLTADPVTRITSGGTKTVSYSLANNQRYKDKEDVSFLRCICFGGNADFAEKYLKKGIKIIVEARVKTGTYKKEDRDIPFTDFIVQSQYFCESKKDSSGENAAPQAQEAVDDEEYAYFENLKRSFHEEA